MTKKIKGIACLSLTALFSLSMFVSQNVSLAKGDGVTTVGGVTLTDVTGQVDMSHIQQANFNTAVMENNQPSYSKKTVIVSLEGGSIAETKGSDQSAAEYLSTASGKTALRNIESTQLRFLSTLSAKGIPFSIKNSYTAVDNAVAIEVDTSYVAEIKGIDGVKSAVVSQTYALSQTVENSTTTVAGSSATVNETQVYKTGIYDSSEFAGTYDGKGMVVAILDTGLDYTHVAFQKQPDSRYLGLNQTDVKNLLDQKDFAAEARTALSGDTLAVEDVYVSDKVPFAYDYSDDDADVYPSYSNHGTHVAGIVGGYSEAGYTDKDGNHVPETFIGVAPEAQLVICKVFTDDLEDPDLGGAVSEDILAALEDCILLNVDVINMSLGTTAGFTTTDDVGDDEGIYMNGVYNRIQSAGISLVAAASNDYSSAYGGTFGTNLATQPDSGTVGSPSTYAAALSVASISGQQAKYILGNPDASGNGASIFYEEASDKNSVPFDFAEQMLNGENTAEYEYVVVPGVGQAADYSTSIRRLFNEKPGQRIALVKRGTTNFQEKVEIAMEMGAKAIIVYNNVAGKIRMNLGDVDDPIPAISITLEAGNTLVAGAVGRVGKIKLDTSLLAGPFMSDFSSWGPTPDLKLKPEITAHGGEITSTVPGGYDEQSGTSMASPNMAGVMALVRDYIDSNYSDRYQTAVEINRFANQLIMSTATTAYDEEGLPYSPRKQGAGLASLSNVIKTRAYIYTENAEIDYRPKYELGDDKEKTGVYTVSFNIENFDSQNLTFKAKSLFMTETEEKLSNTLYAVAEKAHMLGQIPTVWEVTDIDGNNAVTYSDGDEITVPAGQTLKASVTFELHEDERDFIEQYFTNGMYVEGFCKLESTVATQCDLVIPFLGFYGNWDDAPLLDYDCFEVSEFEQDAQYTDETRPKAQIWATQAYTSYYNDKYVLPLGGYVYVLPEEADPMYVKEDYGSISRYNEYVSEDGVGNYLTSTGLKAVYAGLLRNVRYAEYKIYNDATGELLEQDTVYRIGKAYASGGSSRPAYIKFEVNPDEYGFVANGKYRVEFDFRRTEDSEYNEENTFTFSFYIDYEAPIVQDARIRYYDYEQNNKQKQRIYLDVDVYDNHYPQSLMLCYLDKQGNNQVLQLATEYITPVRNPVKNGTTTVSIEITDIYDEYKDKLYLQVDDYSLNHTTYAISTFSPNVNATPDMFELAEGQENITLNIYQTHKVALNYQGEANLSNFTWSSNNMSVAQVKNGEIVGLKKGNATITVKSGQTTKTLKVTVTDQVENLAVPSISFGTIIDANKSVAKAQGMVEVKANQDFTLNVITDPWYYPVKNLKLLWSSTDESVATVDQNGNVTCLKKGTAIIKAQIVKEDGTITSYSTTVTLSVQDEFTVSNFTLIDYGGRSPIVEIPSDKNIMYIGEEAFKDNDYITKVILPKTVMQINERAFVNCTSLKEVTFTDDMKVTDSADLNLIGYRAFYNCTALETVDFTRAKVVTIGNYAFENCTSLKQIINMENAVGTMHDGAFMNCTKLESVNLSGLHMSGSYVFSGCTSLREVITDKFTAIGEAMFNGCTALQSIEIKTPNVGAYAFRGCRYLNTVTFNNPVNANGSEEQIKIMIGESAFNGCINLANVNFNNCTVISIGNNAFSNTKISSFTIPNGVISLGDNLFTGCANLTEITLSDGIDLTKLEKLGCAFSGLTVKIATDSTVYKYNQAGNAIYDISGKTLVKVLNAEGIFEIDAGTENIAPYAFANSKVTGVALPYSIKTIGEGAFMNSDLAQITIAYDSQIEEIKPYTFYGTDITEIELPGFTTVIGDYAFAKSALTSIEFLGTTLGDNVFDGCTNLTEIVLYDSIEVMGSRVFANCSALQKVTLPSVKELGYGTFLNSPALKEVTFGENATTTGVATFMSTSTDGRINLTKVVLGNATKEIGDSAFENCVNLTSIDLKGATKVGEAAFYGCTKLETVTGLENVEIFGEYAFALCPSIKTLNLNSAKTIGALAFAMLVEDDVEVYTQINIPKVQTIGELAFYGGSQTSVTLPATLTFVDYGAFNSSKNLTAITVENGNACYFSENGVLYRYITDTTYELVAYPTALVAKEDAEGLKTYEVKVGTVTVLADSFSFLNEDVLDKVIFPYSLKTIGDEAMYASGVSVYEFNSIAAPTLEASYREDIQSIISSYDSQSSSFKGYFYSNFNELFVYFSEFVNQKSDLTIRYPENGTGYDNYIYGRYFGEKVTTGVHMDDSTRQTIAEITALKDAQTVKGWLAEGAAITKAEVEAFSELVKNARRLYDNIKSEAQLAYVDQSLVEKLLQVETELRAVKAKFGIIVSVSRLIYDATNCKVEYLVGEEFNPEGLIVTAVYDDGSTEVLDVSKLTLVTTGKLTKWDRYVEYKGPENKSLRVQITVTEKATHVCESVCPECGKCQDASCTEAACADKCQGHHVCESVCPDCGKCQNANCTDPVCQEKCSGHETEGGCKDYGASLIATFIALATVAVVLVIKKRRNARG